MSQTIDNRIVEIQFENKQFESGVQESLSTLDKLKNALKFDDASKNLTDFSKNINKNVHAMYPFTVNNKAELATIAINLTHIAHISLIIVLAPKLQKRIFALIDPAIRLTQNDIDCICT